MNVIVDEKETVKLGKNEVLLLALNDCNNKKLFQRAKFLFKLGLYSKEEVASFDEEAYIEVSSKTIKGYSLLTDEEGELYLVKELQADSETDSYGYEVLALANPSEDEMRELMHCHKPVCVGKIVLVCAISLFTLLALVGFFKAYFDGLASTGEVDALAALEMPFLCYGASVILGLSSLLLAFKGNKKCCKR